MVSTNGNIGKYVGEQDANELEECLMEPSTRHLEQIVIEDKEKASEYLDMFMGTNVTIRREYLLAHSEEVDVD